MSARIAFASAAAVAFAALGCSRAVTVESGGDVGRSTVVPANSSYLPAGSTFTIQLDNSLGSAASVGQTFTAHVTDALVATNGSVVVPSGATVTGHVTAIDTPSDPTRPALIRLDFDNLSFNGRTYPLTASVARTTVPSSNTTVMKGATTGAVAGGVLGAVLGKGDLKDILVGSAIGAAAGSVISLGIPRDQATLPAGTRFVLQTSQGVNLR